jgi:hypothetical protein
MRIWTFIAKSQEERDSWVTDITLAKNNLLAERGLLFSFSLFCFFFSFSLSFNFFLFFDLQYN